LQLNVGVRQIPDDGAAHSMFSHLGHIPPSVERRLAELPPWARPPFYGVLLVYGLALAKRGGLIVPLLILGVLLGGPEAALRMGWIILAAGIAGFAGGLAYTVAHLMLYRLGRAGAILTGWLAVFAYSATLFFLLGSADAAMRARFDLREPVPWIILGAAAVLLGTVLGLMLWAQGQPPPGPGKRRTWIQRPQKVTSRVHPPTA
jgi:hypothetical protein